MVIRPTRLPSRSLKLAASLAMVVVLPTPVGPMRATTCGLPVRFTSMPPASGRDFSITSSSFVPHASSRPASCSRVRVLRRVSSDLVGDLLGHLVLDELPVGLHQFFRQGRAVGLAALLNVLGDHAAQDVQFAAKFA